MARITTIPLFKSQSIEAGASGTSDPIDLRYCSSKGMYSVHYLAEPSTSGTCGTTIFAYTGCSTRDGVYGNPSTAGTFATAGTVKDQITPFSPILTPFMKIIATQTGLTPDATHEGANSKITAELNVQ